MYTLSCGGVQGYRGPVSAANPSVTTPASPLARWALSPDVLHLNHGSFGGCPRTVLAAADAVRARLEAAPMRFYVLDWQRELDRARAALSRFVGADPARLAFVPSATAGVAIALAAADLAAGDEVLLTAHGYRACANQVHRLAGARGLRVATVPIDLPFDPDALVERLERAVSRRTRLVVIDHVTSPTALRLPVERIVPAMRAQGVQVLVDGAHAPGQVPLDVEALGATWYVGNCHKWLCGPKASGFVVASPDAAASLRPLITSHGATPGYGPANRLHAELDWSGTYDPAPQLAVPVAIEAVAAEGGGWPQVVARNHALALAFRDRLGGRALGPDAAIGSMIALPIALPAGATAHGVERALLEAGCEVPVIDGPGGPLVRVSAHLYNHAGEADLLALRLHALGVALA